MINQKKFLVSHAPFWHDGSSVSERSYHIMIAALPAIAMGVKLYGVPAIGMMALSISSAIIWEYLFNVISKRPVSVGDGNAAVIGMVFGMMLPAAVPWWLVITGTFIAVIIGKEIYGGIGGNPFNPAAVGMAILLLSWDKILDFNAALVSYDFGFTMIYPLDAAKSFGAAGAALFSPADLLMGQQAGGVGAVFGLGLIIGGVYLILRGFIRWEISLSFIAGVFVTAYLFHMSDSVKYAGPVFHVLTGYTLLGAFFLATDDSSSPVNFVPMLIYGAAGGLLTVLIRNIGFWVDGVIFAILIINLINPLLDTIRPKALGKVV